MAFSWDPLVNVLKNPFNPPNPRQPFSKSLADDGGGAATAAAAAASASNNGSLSQYGTTDQFGRSYWGEGANTLAANVQLAPEILAQYQQYSPQYAATDLNNLRTSLFGTFDSGWFEQAHPGFIAEYNKQQAAGELKGWTPEQFAAAYTGVKADDPSMLAAYSGGQVSMNDAITRAADAQTVLSNNTLRAGNMADATEFGGQALDLMKSLNPEQYAAMGQVGAAAQQGVGPNSYQTQLGDMFSRGPQYSQVSGYTVGPTQVSASQNPLLGYANYQAATQGATGLGMDLSTMARQQMALGGGLSNEQARNASQAAREAWSARGLVNSTGAVGDEILNRDAYSQQLLAQRQGFGQNVNQLEQAQQGVNNQFLINALGANATQGAQNLQAGMANQENYYNSGVASAQLMQAAQQANQGAGLQALQLNQSLGTNLAGLDYSRQQQNFGNLLSNANMQSSNAFNPFNTITTAGSANQGTNSALWGQGATASSGGLTNSAVMNQFNPYSAYSSDLYNTNYNAGQAANIAAGNNSAAQTGAALGAIGTIGGALIIA